MTEFSGITAEDRAHAHEILKTSPNLDGDMTALDWIADHGDPFCSKAARLIKILGVRM